MHCPDPVRPDLSPQALNAHVHSPGFSKGFESPDVSQQGFPGQNIPLMALHPHEQIILQRTEHIHFRLFLNE